MKRKNFQIVHMQMLCMIIFVLIYSFMAECIADEEQVPQSIISHKVDRSILVILDTSDSMTDMLQDGSMTRIVAAKDAVRTLVANAGKTQTAIEWALMIFQDCDQTPVVQPFTQDMQVFQNAVSRLHPFSRSPLAQSIRQGVEYIQNSAQGEEGQIIVLTDGLETCGGDPVAEAARIGSCYSGAPVGQFFVSDVHAQTNAKKIELTVICLDTSDVNLKDLLHSIVAAANGTYYEAASSVELQSTMKMISTVKSQKNPGPIVFAVLCGVCVIAGIVYLSISQLELGRFKNEPPVAYLIDDTGKCHFPLYSNKTVSIGRAQGNDIIIQNPYVSKFHARISYSASHRCFIVRDLNSKNYTFVNGVRIGRAFVNIGDEVRVCRTRFKVQ